MQNIADFRENYRKELEAAAGELRQQSMPGLTEELFSLFERTGNRLQYENVYFLRRKFLSVFGVRSCMDGRREDIEKLEEVIADICAEECWALPAHVDRVGDPDWRHTLDLFACETAASLVELGEALKTVLRPETVRRIRSCVLERVLEPFERSTVPCGVWENCSHNWNAVCGGSIGIAAIYLLREETERKKRLLARICASLTHYIDGFSDDGACMEGLGYFTYGMSFYAAFAELLYRDTGGQCDLMAGEKLARIMEFPQKCYFPGGLSVSFSDGSSCERFRVGLTCYFHFKDEAVSFPPMELAAGLHADFCYRWVILYRDYLWTERYAGNPGGLPVQGEERLARDSDPRGQDGGEQARCGGPQSSDRSQKSDGGQVTLTDAQWSVCRSKNGAGLAAKGGSNGEPHNHNDVGSFHYVIGDEVFLADLGAGEYTKEYFRDETRYQIFVNQSLSHNVPLVNGRQQEYGEVYRCTHFSTDGGGTTELEFAAAYREPRLKNLKRTIRFNMENGSFEVEDWFHTEGAVSVTENLVTPMEPRILKAGERAVCPGPGMTAGSDAHMTAGSPSGSDACMTAGSPGGSDAHMTAGLLAGSDAHMTAGSPGRSDAHMTADSPAGSDARMTADSPDGSGREVPERSGVRILLRGEKHACVLYLESGASPAVTKKNYPDHAGQIQTVYLVQWKLEAAAKAGASATARNLRSRFSCVRVR